MKLKEQKPFLEHPWCFSHFPILQPSPSVNPQTQISLLCNTRHIATFRAAAETDVILWAKPKPVVGFHWVFLGWMEKNKNAEKLEKDDI